MSRNLGIWSFGVVSVAFLTMLSGSPAVAKPAITLCVGDWEGYASADLKSGAYIDLVNMALADDYELKWTRYSYSRCDADFKAGKFDVLVGENKPKGRPHGTAPFDTAKLLAVYSEKKFPKWDEGTVLSTGKLAWLRGYGFESIVPNKSPFTEVNATVQGLRQLLAGRFDVFMDDDIDVLTAALETPEFKGKGLKITETKIKENMILVFKESPETKNLIKVSDKKIADFRSSGKLKELYVTKYKVTFVD